MLFNTMWKRVCDDISWEFWARDPEEREYFEELGGELERESDWFEELKPLLLE